MLKIAYEVQRTLPWGLENFLNKISKSSIIKKPTEIIYYNKATTFIEDIGKAFTKTLSDKYCIEIVYTQQNELFKQIPENTEELFNLSNLLKINMKHKIRVFNNQRYTLIITNRVPSDKYCITLLGALPLLVPDFISEENTFIFKNIPKIPWSLFNYQQNELYIKAMQEILKPTKDLNELKNNIKTFFIDTFENRKKDLQAQISTTKSETERLCRLIQEYYTKIDSFQNELFDLQHKDPEENLEALQTFLKILNTSNDILHYEFIANTGNLILGIVTPIKYFDENAAQRLCNSITDTKKAQFIKKVLLEEEYKIDMYTVVSINLKSKSVRAINNSETIGANANDTIRINKPHAIPNPHLMGYNCWGQYSSEIIKTIHSGQQHIALTLILAAAGSLNILDTPVMQKLMQSLENTNTPLYKNNKYYNITDLI